MRNTKRLPMFQALSLILVSNYRVRCLLRKGLLSHQQKCTLLTADGNSESLEPKVKSFLEWDKSGPLGQLGRASGPFLGT